MFEFLKHVLLKPQFIIIFVAVIAGIYYPNVLKRMKSSQNEVSTSEEKIFTKEELAKFNGENDAPLYLALVGSVYDVSRGKKHYGSGCAYNYFVGRDASVSFITGEFENYDEHKADDVLSLKPKDLLSLDNWKKFYDTDYTFKGKLIGRFYDEKGDLTTYHHKYIALLEHARELKLAAENLKVSYPDCNIEWSAETGTRVWCTRSSGGGTERDWVGYPRKLYEIGSESFRCACVREEDLDTTAVLLRPYENCDKLANECYYKID